MLIISRSPDGSYYIVNSKDYTKRGIYDKDGNLLSGEQILEKEEAAFRIWYQIQPPSKLTENQQKEIWREQYNVRCTNKNG